MFRMLCLMLLMLPTLWAMAARNSIVLNYRKVNNFPVKYVTVNMNDPEVVVATAVAPSFPNGLESWSSYLTRLQPDAAINGTYFCLRTNMPVGDVAVEGNLIYKGVVGTALCITPDNRVVMRPGPRQQKPNWAGFRTVLCAGPRLLTAGKVTIDARAEGFRDPRVLGSAPRSAVAWRPDNILILLTIETNISLQNLAWVCQHLGATEAMALDGGNSSGLYAEGRTVTRPGRGLSNILAVYGTREQFAAVSGRLAPANLPVFARLLQQSPVAVAGAALPRPVQPARPQAESRVVNIVTPDASHPVQGTVAVRAELGGSAAPQWASLRINGQLRLMSNVWPLEYRWDTTREPDGINTLEVTAWSKDRAVLGRHLCLVKVENDQQVAAR